MNNGNKLELKDTTWTLPKSMHSYYNVSVGDEKSIEEINELNGIAGEKWISETVDEWVERSVNERPNKSFISLAPRVGARITTKKKNADTTVSGSRGLNNIAHSQRTMTQVYTWDNKDWNSNWGSNKQEPSQGSGLAQNNVLMVPKMITLVIRIL